MGIYDRKGEAEFPFNRDVVFDAICQAVTSFENMSIDSSDKLSGRIQVKTGINLLNFGEHIPIQLLAIDENKTKVQITSGPKGGFWLSGPVDFGRNKKNIDKILTTTSTILASKKTSQPETKKSEGISDSVADELKKLKSLMDEGILTQEEFIVQKAKLLK